MKFQKPAQGISQFYDFGHSKAYHVDCTCGNDDHRISFDVESEDGHININTYVTVSTDYWTDMISTNGYFTMKPEFIGTFLYYSINYINSVVRKVKLTYNIWVKGYYTMQSTLMMNEQQSYNYAKTIELAIKEVKTHNEQN